jgi:octaprenyl-diphosphate synthase
MNQEYIQRIKKIDAELEYWLPQEPDSAWAEKVFGGIGKNVGVDSKKMLLTPLRELLFRGGKRWRPLFMTLVCEAFGGGDAAIPLSPIVEFSHNASLIHDDIEDESDERRGKPTIHRLFGVDTAINSGSFLYFLATSCIESFTQGTSEIKNKKLIYKFWAECMRRLHLGQAMDISWHRNVSYIPEIEEYFLMCAMKTGSLARLAAELGAHAAGVSAEVIQQLGDAADKIGIGYQILDDVKNLTTGIPGKKRGDDVVEGKKGLPILLYMQKHPERRERIFYYFHVAKQEGTSAPEVEELIDTLSNAGVFAEAEEIGYSFLKGACDVFNCHEIAGFQTNESGRTLLNGFINLIS